MFDWWEITDKHSGNEWTQLPNRMNSILDQPSRQVKRLAWFVGLVAACYVATLIASVELTIQAAELVPTTDLLNPGELLPLITGVLAFITAVANLPTEDQGVSSYAETLDRWRGRARSRGYAEVERGQQSPYESFGLGLMHPAYSRAQY